MNLETKQIETTLAGRKITVEVEKRSGTTETFWLYLLLNNELIAVITATEDYFTYEIYQQK